MWPTVTASVYARDWTATDRLGNKAEAWASTPTTAAVLVAPGSTTDLPAERADGVRVDLTLHFNKTWTDAAGLRDAKVTLPAPWEGTYRVVGVPEPYDARLVPGELWLPVEVVRWDG